MQVDGMTKGLGDQIRAMTAHETSRKVYTTFIRHVVIYGPER